MSFTTLRVYQLSSGDIGNISSLKQACLALYFCIHLQLLNIREMNNVYMYIIVKQVPIENELEISAFLENTSIDIVIS